MLELMRIIGSVVAGTIISLIYSATTADSNTFEALVLYALGTIMCRVLFGYKVD